MNDNTAVAEGVEQQSDDVLLESRADRHPAAPPSEPQPPVRRRELLAVALLVVLADLTIYRGEGYAGYGALFFAAPLLLLAAAPRVGLRSWLLLVGAMLAIVAVRLVWLGNGLQVTCGLVLLAAFAM